jgi:hypothetical protein
LAAKSVFAYHTSPGLEVRERGPDTRHAVWVDLEIADLERNLLLDNVFAAVEGRHLRAIYFGPTGDLHPSEIGFSSLTTIDDGSSCLDSRRDTETRRWNS